MCGIIGAVAERPVNKILLSGLKLLEYRGYDSAGLSNISETGSLQTVKAVGKVNLLEAEVSKSPSQSTIGIAHTRWATHGSVTQVNAHPHTSRQRIAAVHNGIIENHQVLRQNLEESGYEFVSTTDSEVIAHLMHQTMHRTGNALKAMQAMTKQLQGAYGTVVMDALNPNELIAARSGSPLVIGIGLGEHYVASDPMALLPVTRLFIYLEEGDVARITKDQIDIYCANGLPVQRPVVEVNSSACDNNKGDFRHYMLKEIFEQPTAIRQTLAPLLSDNTLQMQGLQSNTLNQINHVQIIACGTSYHAGLVAKYWLEQYAGISCSVEIASEYRYRHPVIPDRALLVAISQSGETADTLAALRQAKKQDYLSTLAVTNTAASSLAREADGVLLTHAGLEVGVASTKAFTTQLTCLLALTAALAKDIRNTEKIIETLATLPSKIEESLLLDEPIQQLACDFNDKAHSIFLGRGSLYPIAMEGALKLKEISYMHAHAYAAGELKHGPLALIDDSVPVVVVAPNDELLSKLASNIAEVRARGGLLYVFADDACQFNSDETMQVRTLGKVEPMLAPIIYTIPLQLLAYHVAVIKGTDVDQPRNLAKSVTVE
nr:glutamine--fructose-6-phosphate transaminase (isomerizing) [Salinibius halmophilus]